MQIIIQQREVQIVRADAVGTVFIHPQRRRIGEIAFQLTIQRRETAIKTHHQR